MGIMSTLKVTVGILLMSLGALGQIAYLFGYPAGQLDKIHALLLIILGYLIISLSGDPETRQNRKSLD